MFRSLQDNARSYERRLRCIWNEITRTFLFAITTWGMKNFEFVTFWWCLENSQSLRKWENWYRIKGIITCFIKIVYLYMETRFNCLSVFTERKSVATAINWCVWGLGWICEFCRLLIGSDCGKLIVFEVNPFQGFRSKASCGRTGTR